jgi:hypothetical protein
LQFTTPEFGALLKKEWAYSKGEVGHIYYDPWLGVQEDLPKGQKPDQIALKRLTSFACP